jgi:hypothetical protein
MKGRIWNDLKEKITFIVENLLNHKGVFTPSDEIRDLALSHRLSKFQTFINFIMMFCKAC